MKNSAKYLSLALAAGVAGAGLFAAASSNFTSFITGNLDAAVAATVAVSLVGFASYDYSRRRPLVIPARLLRPTLPAVNIATSKIVAYRAKSSRNRLAA